MTRHLFCEKMQDWLKEYGIEFKGDKAYLYYDEEGEEFVQIEYCPWCGKDLVSPEPGYYAGNFTKGLAPT